MSRETNLLSATLDDDIYILKIENKTILVDLPRGPEYIRKVKLVRVRSGKKTNKTDFAFIPLLRL